MCDFSPALAVLIAWTAISAGEVPQSPYQYPFSRLPTSIPIIYMFLLIIYAWYCILEQYL